MIVDNESSYIVDDASVSPGTTWGLEREQRWDNGQT